MDTYIRPVTPAQVSPAIQNLCSELSAEVQPQYVDVRPAPLAKTNDCFPNVERQVQEHGGYLVLGWSLWEWPTLFVEAEFHAVWRAPDQTLLDVTPKRAPTQRILFLSDASGHYCGRQVNNVRRSTLKHPMVTEFLKASDDEYELMNRGERANQHGAISLLDSEAQEYDSIQRRKAACFLEMPKLKPRIGPYDPCLCGSGKKVKWCHGTAS